MAYIPTTVQNRDHILEGACKISIAAYGVAVPAWLDIGAVNGCTITENLGSTKQESQNVRDTYAMSAQSATVTMDWFEQMYSAANQILRSDIDNITNIAGALVSGATQTVDSGDWGYDKFVKIENQNGDGSAITVNSVTGGTDGALVLTTDYVVGQNNFDEYGIYLKSGGNITTLSQDLVIDYDYTPTAKQQIDTGGFDGEIPKFQMKIENIYAVGKNVTYYIWLCQLTNGRNLEFKKYNEDDTRLVATVEIEAQLDPTRSAANKDQLMRIENERI
jgi:hypothetical protein